MFEQPTGLSHTLLQISGSAQATSSLTEFANTTCVINQLIKIHKIGFILSTFHHFSSWVKRRETHVYILSHFILEVAFDQTSLHFH